MCKEPSLQGNEHPMNPIIQVHKLVQSLHAGSSSCAFDPTALLDMGVKTVPLYNWEGSEKTWWRQAWKYTGKIAKDALTANPFTPAGPSEAGGTNVETEALTPICFIVMHTAASKKKTGPITLRQKKCGRTPGTRRFI